MIADANVVKVSVIGVGMRSHAGVAQRMFQALAEKGINIQVISTSEIKVSVLIARNTPSWRCARCTPPTGSTRRLRIG